MTREAFIRKWLANKDFQYCEDGRSKMREDLDKVIDYHQTEQKLQQPVIGGPVSDVRSEGEQLGNEAGEKSVRVDISKMKDIDPDVKKALDNGGLWDMI